MRLDAQAINGAGRGGQIGGRRAHSRRPVHQVILAWSGAAPEIVFKRIAGDFSVPASSTPVGPAPTMTKVSHARRRSGRAQFGRLKGVQHLPAYAVACSSVLSLSDTFHSSSGVGVVEPAATTSVSYGNAPTVEWTRWPGTSIPVTPARTVTVF
jgi:hypothetical protein